MWANQAVNKNAFQKGFTSPVSNFSVKNTIDMFNQSEPTQNPAANLTQPQNFLNSPTTGSLVKYRAQYLFEATREDELSLQVGDIINVNLSIKTDEGWMHGDCNGRSGVFPASFTVKVNELDTIQELPNLNFEANFSQPLIQAGSAVNTPISPVTGMIPKSGSFRSSSSFPSQSAINTTQLSQIKNYFFSIYPYNSTEPGDLIFREFEIINVIDSNEDWLTGQIVGSGIANNPLRSGIFPSNFVIKFSFPIEYIGKYTIGMATEVYQAQNGGELTLNPAESQLIAIKKLSPDGKWSFGESYDANNSLQRGWFPIQSAMPLIDANVVSLNVPSSTVTSNNRPGISGNKTISNSGSISSISSSPPPPMSKVVSPVNTISPESSTNALSTQRNQEVTINASSNPSINSLPITSTNLEASSPLEKLTNTAISAASNKNTSTPKPKNLVKESTSSDSTVSTNNPKANIELSEVNNIEKTSLEPQSGPSTLPAGVIDQVIALYDFASTTPETIGFSKDTVINIIEKSGDWWLGEFNGKMGLLPYNYVQSIMKTNELS